MFRVRRRLQSTGSTPHRTRAPSHAQTILVTGGTAGLGLHTVVRLAITGARVIFTARTRRRGEDALDIMTELLRKAGHAHAKERISFEVCDQSELHSVRACAARLTAAHSKLHAIVLK